MSLILNSQSLKSSKACLQTKISLTPFFSVLRWLGLVFSLCCLAYTPIFQFFFDERKWKPLLTVLSVFPKKMFCEAKTCNCFVGRSNFSLIFLQQYFPSTEDIGTNWYSLHAIKIGGLICLDLFRFERASFVRAK